VTRPLRIDFGSRARTGAWWGFALLFAGALATIATVERYGSLDEERERLEAGLRERNRAKPAARAPAGTATGEATQRQNDARRSVVRALGRPWDALFRDIEAAASEGIALLALEPDPRRGEVRVAGEAREPLALYEYIAALERTESMSQVRLTQHELVRGAGAGAVRFVLVGVWQGARG
jgi:hypothetical protein